MQNIVFIEDRYAPGQLSVLTEAHLKSKFKDINIIRLSGFQNVIEASLNLKAYMDTFPDHTIFFALANLKVNTKSGLLFFEYGKQHIILPDNGAIGYLYNVDLYSTDVFRIDSGYFIDYSMLWQTLVLITEAVWNNKISTISVKTNDFKRLRLTSPQVRINGFNSNLLFFTESGSAVCDLRKEDFYEKLQNFSSYKIIVKEKLLELDSVQAFPMEKAFGDPYAIFNQYGHLEVGLVNSDLKSTFRLNDSLTVKIDFYE